MHITHARTNYKQKNAQYKQCTEKQKKINGVSCSIAFAGRLLENRHFFSRFVRSFDDFTCKNYSQNRIDLSRWNKKPAREKATTLSLETE